MARNVINSNIERLTQNREVFFPFVDTFDKKQSFTGPSAYFHKQVIEQIRTCEDRASLLDNTRYLENIYATLASWGMHRMGPTGAKMVDFNEFVHSINALKDDIVYLSAFKLHQLTRDDLDSLEKTLLQVFDRIKVMQSNVKLVGNSKVIHHLLPDLVPPIDRQYTLRFFFGSTWIPQGEEIEKEMFIEIMEEYRKICQRLNLKSEDYQNRGTFTTSIPKMIDNAIIGYLVSNKGVDRQ